jgi:hypothetical protein
MDAIFKMSVISITCSTVAERTLPQYSLGLSIDERVVRHQKLQTRQITTGSCPMNGKAAIPECSACENKHVLDSKSNQIHPATSNQNKTKINEKKKKVHPHKIATYKHGCNRCNQHRLNHKQHSRRARLQHLPISSVDVGVARHQKLQT